MTTERVREALAYATAAKSGAAAALRNAELAENLLIEELGEEPAPVPERITHGPGRLREATTTFGAPLGPVPKTWLSVNLDRQRPDLAANSAVNACIDAEDAGNVVLTVPLAWHGPGPNRDKPGSLAALEAVARGDYDRYYEEIATALAEGGRSTPKYPSRSSLAFPRAVLRLGHEHNGGWYPWSSGFGRGALFAEAWRRVAAIFRRVCPEAALDFNLAHSGADPDGVSTAPFDPESWPGDEWVDIIGRDLYCRSAGRNADNIADELDAHAALGEEHGKPLSFPEVGVALPVPGSTSNQAATDTQAGAFFELVFGFADRCDLAYLTVWASGRTDQGYRYRPSPADTRTWAALASAYS